MLFPMVRNDICMNNYMCTEWPVFSAHHAYSKKEKNSDDCISLPQNKIADVMAPNQRRPDPSAKKFSGG